MTVSARAIIQRRVVSVRQCKHLPWKLALAFVSALGTGYMLRVMAGIIATIAPAESYAADLAQEIVGMTGLHFWLSMGFASFGGVASLFHDLRQRPERFSLVNAIGHLFISQFSGLLAFVGVVGARWTLPWALGTCGLAGWMGAAAITRASTLIERKASLLAGVADRGPPG